MDSIIQCLSSESKNKHVSQSVCRDSGLPGSSVVLPTRGLGICKQPLPLLEMRSMRSVHSCTKLILDTCMILLVTCKIPSCGLLTIKALSEKDELHDMMSIKSCRGTAMDLLLSPFPGSDCKHQISGASELLTLGFLSPTSSCNEGKKCQEPHSVLAG